MGAGRGAEKGTLIICTCTDTAPLCHASLQSFMSEMGTHFPGINSGPLDVRLWGGQITWTENIMSCQPCADMEDPTIGWDGLQFALNSLHLPGCFWELSIAPTRELSNLLDLSRDQQYSVFLLQHQAVRADFCLRMHTDPSTLNLQKSTL